MQDLTPLQEYLDSVADRGRTMLLPALHKTHALYGWASREAQIAISQSLRVPLADIHGVIEFYSMFYNEPMPKRIIRVCEDPACHLAGAHHVSDLIKENLDPDTAFEHVTCLGLCDLAPAALNGPTPAAPVALDTVPDFLASLTPAPLPKVYGSPNWITARVGHLAPTLTAYQHHGGYRALPTALAMSPDELITFAESTGIVGRGGAMFPLGRKWRFTRNAEGETKHILVNADESEPGTFKDRVLMEEDPFALVEAMTVAAHAVGAENGWIFVRGEYPRAFARLEEAVRQARDAGYLGKDILGKPGFNFDIELRMGAGAYICGEETALFEAIEGKRGFPRIKPPFPVTHGLFNQPTAINNVETLLAFLAALNFGLDAWKAQGTQNSPGSKLFCLSGHVARPGVYEVPFGLTIAELIEMAGGVSGELQAVLMGGAAGVFIGPEQLNTRLTYEDCRTAGIPIGSGVIMVFNQSADLRETLYQLARFFAHESCGKCFPCQLGTQRQKEILDHIAHNGGAKPTDRQTLLDLGFTMTETSLCGLGQTAASAVMSAIRMWPELVE